MASRWSQNNVRSSSRTSNRPVPGSEPDLPSVSSSKRGRIVSDRSSTPVQWSEPPPLDESCAKYVLSVMVLFLRQTATEPPLVRGSTLFSDVSFRDYENSKAVMAASAIDIQMASNTNDTDDTEEELTSKATRRPSSRVLERELRAKVSSNSVRSGSGRMSATTGSSTIFPGHAFIYENTHMSSVKSRQILNTHIAKFAGRVIFSISASNWRAVFSRLSNKIRQLALHEENFDAVDLHTLGHCLLDRQRLMQVLNGMPCARLSQHP
jgi:hypothetical protein